MFPAWEIILTGVVAGLLAGGAVWLLPFARAHRWYPLAGVATVAGWMLWNFSLNAADATGFDVDAPIVRVSGQDVGSALTACLLVFLVLALLQPRAPAGKVALTGIVAGFAALVWDVFVL